MILKSVEKPEENIAQLLIEAEKAEFEAALEKSYRKNAGRFNVPGFRRGKAPRRAIERLYGASAFYEDAVNIAYPDVYSAAVEEAGITPVDSAEVELIEIGENGFTFSAKVTTKPEVVLGQYKGLEAEVTEIAVTDEDVEKELERRRKRAARLESAERAAKEGDTVVIDFEGFLDGVPFEGGKAESHSLRLGSGQFIPGFEDQLSGVLAGDETEVNVTFPEDYQAGELAGKPVVFKVKVHEVKEEILPELDDELAKDVSEFETLDALRADIREKLEKVKEKSANDDFENRLIDKLLENMTANLPDCMIEQQLDRIEQDFEYRMRAQGMTLDAYLNMSGMDRESFRKTFRDQAERQVRTTLALEAVSKAENFEITGEELEAEYERLAGEIKASVEDTKKYMSPEAVREDLEKARAIGLIKDSAVKLAPSEKPGGDEKKKPAAKKPAAKKTAAKDSADTDSAPKKPAAKKPAAKKAAEKPEEAKMADEPAEEKAGESK